MTTSLDILLTTKTAHQVGADFGMRTRRVGSPWDRRAGGLAAGPVVIAMSDGAHISTEVPTDRNLHALAARCAG